MEAFGDPSRLEREERQKYDIMLKRYRDAMATLAGAEMEGEKKGEMEGRMQVKREVAARMKSLGLSVEIIKEVTDLSEEEIAQL